MTFQEAKAKILLEQAKRKAEGKDDSASSGSTGWTRGTGMEAREPKTSGERMRIAKIEKCKYAMDTGEVAFPAAPCRGNRIICQHPENAGFISYTKQCKKESCLFFEAGGMRDEG